MEVGNAREYSSSGRKHAPQQRFEMRAAARRRLRRRVAMRFGCHEGDMEHGYCAYCGAVLLVVWDVGGEPEFLVCEPGSSWPSDERAHLDHVIPEALNGPTSIDNTVVACPSCNLAKGAKPFGDADFQRWLRERRGAVEGMWVA